MADRPAVWFLRVAMGAGVLAVLMVGAMEGLQHYVQLPLWLHIPLTVVVLTLMGGGACVTGAALVEYRQRTPFATRTEAEQK